MRRRQGFTVIEVMVAIGVMTVGVMAIIGMQVQAQRQNQLAREFQLAMQFAQSWSERLKVDALLWTDVATANGSVTTAQALQNTRYLGALLGNGTNFVPIVPAATSFHKQGATPQGYDLPSTGSQLTYPDPLNPSATRIQSFCADARVAWVYFGRALRADVRVFWPKPGVDSTQPPFQQCSDPNATLRPGGTAFQNYHAVYVPNVLRVTELGQGS
jgi:type IV pilus assembly protein PilV